MSGAIPSFLQYTFMAWCSVKAQEQLCLYWLGNLEAFTCGNRTDMTKLKGMFRNLL